MNKLYRTLSFVRWHDSHDRAQPRNSKRFRDPGDSTDTSWEDTVGNISVRVTPLVRTSGHCSHAPGHHQEIVICADDAAVGIDAQMSSIQSIHMA